MSETEQAVRLEPCRFCGRSAKIEAFQIDDDPQWWYVATCVVCPVKTYDQFTAEEAARIWNTRASDVALQPSGEWRHVHIPAGNQRVVAIEFDTAEEATEFINKFATTPVTAPVSTGEQACGPWREAATIVQACLNVHSTYSDAEREFAAHLIEVFNTRDQHPDYQHRNTVRAYPAATSTTPDGEQVCKCGLPKDDAIHSFSTEWQQMHKFTLKDAATPPPAVTEACGYCASPEHFSAIIELPDHEGRWHRSTGGGYYRCTAQSAPPSTSAAIRAAAREWMNTWHGAFATNKEREDALVAILSRWFGKGETDKSFVNEFTEATIEAHVGYHHEKTFHDCDYAVCAKRREMIDALHTAAPGSPSPGEPRDQCEHGISLDEECLTCENQQDEINVARTSVEGESE